MRSLSAQISPVNSLRDAQRTQKQDKSAGNADLRHCVPPGGWNSNERKSITYHYRASEGGNLRESLGESNAEPFSIDRKNFL